MTLYMTQKALFFDLDGTLACNNLPPHQEDAEAIRRVRAMGNRVFLCTGRSMGFLYPEVLDIGFDGIVAGAGAHIVVGDKLLLRRRVSKEWLLPLFEHYYDRPQLFVLEGEKGMFYVNIGCQVQPPRSYRPIPARRPSDDWFDSNPITKLTVYGAPDQEALRLMEELRVIRHPDYAEMVPAGSSKSDGMRRVLEEIGISQENSMAFGDSPNDLDMLEWAGIGIAMGNAIEAVRAAADEVTAPQSQAGIAKALARHFPLSINR
mgnify:CR=1 FL=1